MPHDSGPIIVCAWSLTDSHQGSIFKDVQEEWGKELDNTPVQDDRYSSQEKDLIGAMEDTATVTTILYKHNCNQ